MSQLPYRTHSRNRLWLSAAVCFCGAMAASTAHAADPLGKQGQFAIGAERLFGYVHSSVSYDDNLETTETNNRFSLLSNSVRGFGNVYNTPRLTVDYFVIDRLSVGLGLGYATVSGSTEAGAGGTRVERDTGSRSAFLFSARAGYAFMFTDIIGFWPRAGLTYVTNGFTDPDDNTARESDWALSFEGQLVVTPLPHVMLLIGPTVDVGIAGSRSAEFANTETSVDRSSTEIGVQAGAGVFF